MSSRRKLGLNSKGWSLGLSGLGHSQHLVEGNNAPLVRHIQRYAFVHGDTHGLRILGLNCFVSILKAPVHGSVPKDKMCCLQLTIRIRVGRGPQEPV